MNNKYEIENANKEVTITKGDFINLSSLVTAKTIDEMIEDDVIPATNAFEIIAFISIIQGNITQELFDQDEKGE